MPYLEEVHSVFGSWSANFSVCFPISPHSLSRETGKGITNSSNTSYLFQPGKGVEGTCPDPNLTEGLFQGCSFPEISLRKEERWMEELTMQKALSTRNLREHS